MLPAELARPINSTAPSTPRTDSEDTESYTTHEGGAATDDSVSRRVVDMFMSFAHADVLLGRINSHS
jgi:hypothetical protein